MAESLRQTKANTAATRSALRKEVEALSAQLTRLQASNAGLESDLPQRERLRGEEAERAHLQELIGRMRARLSPEDAAAIGEGPEGLPLVIASIFEQVEAASALRVDRDTEVFTLAGTPEHATVLRIGQVAALRWDPAGRALIDGPEGLREVVGVAPLLPEQQHSSADGGGVLARAVLFDPDDPPEPGQYRTQGWRAKMDAGGPVMWVLLVLGIIAALIVIERTFGLIFASTRWRFEQRRFEVAVRNRTTAELLGVKSWVAKPLVIAAAARCPSCATPLETDIEERATQALMVMREHLQRRLSLVNVVAGVAPLLGLLGTVTGMIHTFSVVTGSGTSEPQQLAAGISQALLTTQFGLVIAIPAFLAHALLSRGARRLLASAEQAVLWYLHGAGARIEPAGDHDHSHGHSHGSHPHEVSEASAEKPEHDEAQRSG